MEDQKPRLIKVTETAAYIPGRVNAGVIIGENNACLVIDTGLDKSAANRISDALAAEGFQPAALLVTHTHADHCGGNAALYARYTMPTYCAPFETSILSHPLLEPVYLYGAAPPAELRNKFFLAPPTPDARALPPGRQALCGISFTAVPLQGHSPGHYGYLTGDGALFAGDAVLPAYVWEKYRLPYFYDIGAALSSLDALEGMAGGLKACVSAHHGLVDLMDLVGINRRGLQDMVAWTSSILEREPTSREGVLAAAFTELGLMQNEAQYWLVGSTVAALLTHLCETGKAKSRMENGKLLYESR